MKKIILTLLLFAGWQTAHADLNVFACEPEWASLVSELGGKHVRVSSATTGLQDPHHIQARPSLIAKTRKADLLVCTGAELEAGWLPVLLKRSGNRNIQPGKPGHFMAAEKVQLLEKLDKVTQGMGDVHAQGNPHIQLDPRRILQVATALHVTIAQLDAGNAAIYQSRFEQFRARWQTAMRAWQQKAAPLRDQPIVAHHNSWVYLQDWLGLKLLATLEPKPGAPPSTRHLSSLIGQLKQQPAKATIYSSYQDPKAAQWLQSKTGIPAINLPSTVGGSKQAKDLFSLFDDIINRLTAAIK